MQQREIFPLLEIIHALIKFSWYKDNGFVIILWRSKFVKFSCMNL